MDKRLLVITPTLGSSAHLEQTLASVAALPVKHTHVLVAPEKALGLLARHAKHCRLLPEPAAGRGMYAAINHALENSGAEWTHFTYINDDDVLHADRVRHWTAALAADPGIAQACYGSVNMIDEESRPLGRYAVSKWPSLNPLLWRSGKVPCTQHGMVITRAAYERCGGFDASFRYVADMAYLLKLQREGCRFRYTGTCVAGFRIRQGQLSANLAAMAEETDRVRRMYGLPASASWLDRGVGRLLLLLMNPLVYWDHLRRNGWVRREDLLHAA